MTTELELVSREIQALLKPLGFKNRKLLWWRELPEITQVIGLDKRTYGSPHYNFRYGLVLHRSRSEDAPPVALNELDVDWNFVNRVSTIDERKHLLSALKMDCPMRPEERQAAITTIVREHVLPTFTATETIEALRMVLQDKKHPCYTPLTTFLPEEL